MKLESYDATEIKRKWRIIRTDYCGPNGGEVEGEIISANEETGECCVQIGGESKTFNFGPQGIRLIGRR